MSIRSVANVRGAFHDDLTEISQHGICFLPEWICVEMSESVLLAGWEPKWYPVSEPAKQISPLALDARELLQEIEKQQLRTPSTKIAVLLAHPFGYLDPSIDLLLTQWEKNKGIHPFLDLSQSYGTFDFGKQISLARRAYISFNGRKLISSGGAITVSPHAASSVEYQNWQSKFARLATGQMSHAVAKFSSLAHSLDQDKQTRIISSFDDVNINVLRSNAHRTALNLTTANDTTLRVKLDHNGFGQPLHPSPQAALWRPSVAYRLWEQSIFLLFPTNRWRSL